MHSSNTTLKFADNTNVVGFIPNNERGTSPCLLNNLLINTSKTKEVIVDYRRSRRTEHPPLLIRGASTKPLLPQETEAGWTPPRLLRAFYRGRPVVLLLTPLSQDCSSLPSRSRHSYIETPTWGTAFCQALWKPSVHLPFPLLPCTHTHIQSLHSRDFCLCFSLFALF